MTTGALATEGFQQAFWTARYSVFRLESDRPVVGDPNFERPPGAPWRQTESKTHWMDLVERRRADGVAMERVKWVREPWSPSARFLLTESFLRNVEAGEHIQIIGLDPSKALPREIPASADFWLFDDAALWWLDYDQDGAVTAARRVGDAAALLFARRAKQVAWALSTRLHAYLSEQGLQATG